MKTDCCDYKNDENWSTWKTTSLRRAEDGIHVDSILYNTCISCGSFQQFWVLTCALTALNCRPMYT